MSELRLRVELNKGRQGIPLHKLAEVAEEAVRFLDALVSDVGIEQEGQAWLAENFENDSVDFDCRYTAVLPEPTVTRGRESLRMVMANDYSPSDLAVLISPETRRQFARMARPLDADEVIRLGLYRDGSLKPYDWFQLDQRRSLEIEEPLSGFRKAYGEIQGIVHAFFKETEKPYLKVRELSTHQLVNCFFPSEMYQSAVKVLADPEAVVFVEGWLRQEAATGQVTEIAVADFRLAPEFSKEVYRSTLGALPDYTGKLSTREFLERLRDE